jgi:polysaccharide biosynthesis/export protein
VLDPDLIPGEPGPVVSRRDAVGALTAFAAAWLTGCSTPQSDVDRLKAPQEILRSSVRFQKEYLLYEGDQIEISVWRTPEVSRTVVVRPDGMISLPLVPEVKAAGLTPRELAENVRAALAVRLVNPEVTVIPVTVRQPTVYVLGEVRSPGAFPLRTAVTAAQAIAVAGGSLRSSAESFVTIIRLSADGYLEAIPLQSESYFSQPGPFMALAAVPLKSDDIVFVPESGRSQVMRVLQDVLVPFQIYLNYKLIQSII